jgi:cytidine deaminase
MVGAALLTRDGTIICGCNVENASYGLTICAERSAISNAVSKGYKPGDIVAIAIASSSNDSLPCGACRQVLSEFNNNMDVIFEHSGKMVLATLSELLPAWIPGTYK